MSLDRIKLPPAGIADPLILIVEDDPVQAQLLDTMLRAMYQNLHCVDSVARALEFLNTQEPDLVMLDYFLPDGTGTDVLRAVSKTGKSTVVAMSASPSTEIMVDLLGAGVADFVRKPVAPLELLLKVTNLMHLRSLVSEHAHREQTESLQKERLQKYFSQELAGKIMSGAVKAQVGGEIVEQVIMICDIRNSTAIAERMPPDAFAAFLTEIFGDMADIVFGDQGSVAQFSGDGFLAIFDAGPSGARAAARTALRLRGHLELYNEMNPHQFSEPLRIGMGIAQGKVFKGTIGSVHRLDYTVLGDPVNLASRLESLTKRAQVDLLIDGATRDALGTAARVKRVRLEQVRGKLEKVSIFFLEGMDEEDR